jgi:hypothetical protein
MCELRVRTFALAFPIEQGWATEQEVPWPSGETWRVVVPAAKAGVAWPRAVAVTVARAATAVRPALVTRFCGEGNERVNRTWHLPEGVKPELLVVRLSGCGAVSSSGTAAEAKRRLH